MEELARLTIWNIKEGEILAVTALIGSMCVGFVWGWLVGLLDGRIKRPILDASAICSATILLSGLMLILSDSLAVALFLVASGLSLFLHISWRKNLGSRSDHLNSGKR
ncbi:MAG TPA: hypothetical protein PLI05_00300 [Methanotrichaceae archaeon]|nr:hypothetical protein [Methanotrichaceae archaeon]HQI90226.1 hypothetical protein [Methanotrichaceae archaeon]HQJ27805.1 hypothetical protein [Methanotrichaceae archaeon]